MTTSIDSIAISGVAYILNGKCGGLRRKMCLPCEGPKDASRILEVQGFIKGQPKNRGRFDAVSLTTFAAALWACVDAGLPFANGKRRIGIVGSSQAGSLDSNRAFFEDYVNAGRNSARSNLFVYTLGTTPLAEVALFCEFTGPLWYMYQPCGGVGRMVEEAALCAAQEDIDAMLAVCADQQEAVCFVMQKSPAPSLFPISLVQDKLKGMTAVGEILSTLGVYFQGEDVP